MMMKMVLAVAALGGCAVAEVGAPPSTVRAAAGSTEEFKLDVADAAADWTAVGCPITYDPDDPEAIDVRRVLDWPEDSEEFSGHYYRFEGLILIRAYSDDYWAWEYSTLRHEMGHMLRLPHTEAGIMAPVIETLDVTAEDCAR